MLGLVWPAGWQFGNRLLQGDIPLSLFGLGLAQLGRCVLDQKICPLTESDVFQVLVSGLPQLVLGRGSTISIASILKGSSTAGKVTGGGFWQWVSVPFSGTQDRQHKRHCQTVSVLASRI